MVASVQTTGVTTVYIIVTGEFCNPVQVVELKAVQEEAEADKRKYMTSELNDRLTKLKREQDSGTTGMYMYSDEGLSPHYY